ncbi:hypothetical protein C8R44DRAFT_894728 [Mycena epipterygia]|nr:hypothetical protein C8R44DRAFT_894728 [Mycena epipterygia]
MPVFNGELAVFSHTVAEIYLHDYVSLGGRIASTTDEVKRADLYICDDRFDSEFIAMWYNDTYRVVNKRYIFDCLDKGFRPPEEMYSWAIDENNFVIPTYRIVEWAGYIRAKPEVSPPEKPSLKEKGEDIWQRLSIGLLTPAPSMRSTR